MSDTITQSLTDMEGICLHGGSWGDIKRMVEAREDKGELSGKLFETFSGACVIFTGDVSSFQLRLSGSAVQLAEVQAAFRRKQSFSMGDVIE